MRVLLVAPACAPFGSEPTIGFNLTKSMAKYAEVVVVTHGFFKSSIEKAGGLGGAEPVYLDLEALVSKAEMFNRRFKFAAAGETLVNFPVSIAFERELWRRFEHELKTGRFDLLHRITPVSSALPSPLASWSPVPLVIGPINGGLPYPWQFRNLMWKEREWIRYIRWFHRFLPYVRSTYRKSAAILASGQHTIDALPMRDRSRIFNLQEVAFDPATFYPPPKRPSRERLTFIFIGRLVPFKGARIAIEAFGSPLLRRHRLLIVGDGPERESLKEQVKNLELEDSVEVVGSRSAAQVAELMRSADVFVFPSIRESGGLVVAEAMASGLACVVTDYGGPGIILTDDTGIKIPLGNAEQLTVRFRDKLEELVLDEELRNRLGEAAANHITESFSWDTKCKMIHEVYRWVLGHQSDKPDLNLVFREQGSSLCQRGASRGQVRFPVLGTSPV